MGWMKRLGNNFADDTFLRRLGKLETLISKALSVAMVIVLLVSVVDLVANYWSERAGWRSWTAHRAARVARCLGLWL